jgi:hypothetical protein
MINRRAELLGGIAMSFIVQEISYSFAIGLLISCAIVYLTPKKQLFVFDDDDDDDDRSLNTHSVVTMDTSSDISIQPTKSGFAAVESDEDFYQSTSPTVGVHRRTRPATTRKITSDIAQKLNKNPKLKQFFGVTEDPEGVTNDIAQKLNKNPKLKQFFGVTEDPEGVTNDIAQKLNKNPKLKRFFGVTEDPEGVTNDIAQKLNKNAKLKRFFGVDNEETLSAETDGLQLTDSAQFLPQDSVLQREKEELRSLLASQPELSQGEIGLFSVVMVCIFVFSVLSILVLVNVATNGDFGRFLTAMFPRETETLKIKDFLDNFHNNVQ